MNKYQKALDNIKNVIYVISEEGFKEDIEALQELIDNFSEESRWVDYE